jgi:hypothetical protein
VPLPEADQPKRPPDTVGGIRETGNSWMEGAEWLYGGVGISGAGCSCWHSRFQMDYFDRSFAPEPDLYSVAALDSAGNLILRVGRYGNPDDGLPLVRRRAAPRPRPIGGDEVGFFYPAYVGVDTDRRLFVADLGNGRIASVKLGYHATEKVSLEEVPDRAGDRD